MNDDTEDFIGGLLDNSSPKMTQHKHVDSSNAIPTIDADKTKSETKVTIKRKWFLPVIICTGIAAVGLLTMLSSNNPPVETSPQHVQTDHAQAQPVDNTGMPKIPVVQENTLLGGNTDQKAEGSTIANPTIHSAEIGSNLVIKGETSQGAAPSPVSGNSGSTSVEQAGLREKDVIIADMKVSIQSRDREIEGLKREIEILKQQKSTVKVTSKESETKARVTSRVRKESKNLNQSLGDSSRTLKRSELSTQSEKESGLVERVDEVRKTAVPESIRILGVTLREGMEMAIVEIAGEKKRIFVGDFIPGLGKVSEINRLPSIIINGVTYR